LAARAGGEAKIKSIYRGDGGRRLISVLAPDRLFREDVMQRLNGGNRGDDANAGSAGSAEEKALQFLVFQLGGDEFALPIAAVHEVARVPDKITRLPKAPEFLEGVINLRGEVLPVVDQRRRFDMPATEMGEGRRLIVVRTERHTAGLIVDGVREVLRTGAETLEPPPVLTDDMSRLVEGVINLEGTGRIIMVLDPKELLSRTEQGLLDAFQAGAEQAPS
jgi:purine-binding chemotaxis protein CheW